MAIKNQALTIMYTAWDTSANAGKTGDNANHTLRIIKDGTANVPTNTPAEVDATNCPGVYKLALTASEMNANSITLAGKSSTANISIIPTHTITESGLLTVLHNLVNIKQATINDGSPTTTKFITTLAETTNGYWVRAAIEFTSGNNIGVIRQIKNYNGSTKEIQLVTPLPNAPVNGDAFSIVMMRNFLVDASPVWDALRTSYATPGTFGGDMASQITSTAIQSAVLSIQNVTTFAGIVPPKLVLPQEGAKNYKLYGRLFDTNGNPEDPDTNTINITIKAMDGSTVVNSTAMTRTGVGAYEYVYTINATDVIRPLVVFFSYSEGTIAFDHPRITEVGNEETQITTIASQVSAIEQAVAGGTYSSGITFVTPPTPLPSH